MKMSKTAHGGQLFELMPLTPNSDGEAFPPPRVAHACKQTYRRV